ncbi:MAG: hypothetical protein RL026_2470 [Pseudomonadota bacterium]
MRPMMLRASLALVLSAWLAAPAQAKEWVTSWAAAPSPAMNAPPPFPQALAVENQTVQQVLRLSAGGSRLRVRLTNEYGGKPLAIGAASIALRRADGSVDEASRRELRFGGSSAAVIPRGAPLLSDAVELPVADRADVVLAVYFPEATGPCTCHPVALQEGLVSEPGNYARSGVARGTPLTQRAWVSAVEVEVARGATLVVLGDSISDGVGSTSGANRRWPDLLAERLLARRGGVRVGIANQGISGNRVLVDGAGRSALARLDRDALAVTGARWLIVFEGVNDLGTAHGASMRAPSEAFPASTATAESMIAGYRQIIARAHANGLKVYGATIAPYKGASYWSEAGEQHRQAINRWIREGGEFDAVLDFDKVFADPADPARMAQAFHSGDSLHGSDAGYEAVARSIDLKLFR